MKATINRGYLNASGVLEEEFKILGVRDGESSHPQDPSTSYGKKDNK